MAETGAAPVRTAHTPSLSGGAKVLAGKRFAARASEGELRDWVASLPLA